MSQAQHLPRVTATAGGAARYRLVAALSGMAVAAVLTGVIAVRRDHPTPPPAEARPVPALTVTSADAVAVDWPVVLDAAGTIAPWQEASIGALLPGLRLVEVAVNVGDVVARGQVLARFDADTLRVAEAQLRAGLHQAQALAAQGQTNHHRSLALKGGGWISDRDLLQSLTQADTAKAQLAAAQAQLAANQLQLRYTDVVAPDDGVISARSATLGAVAAAGQELFRLIIRGRLEWRGELTAAQAAQIGIGQAVTLDLPDGSTARATVRQMAPALDAQTRLLTVYADLEPGSRARAGMYAAGRIQLAVRAAVTVPAASIVIRDGRSYVVTLHGGGDAPVAALQAVETGRRQGAEIEIASGLAAGARVVVAGAAFLGDGDRVRVVPASDRQR